MQQSQRVQWIDNAKGIMLLAVVMYHAYSSSPVLQYVAYWVMPCFFFISGLLFRMRNESVKDTMVHRAKTLLVPYLLLSTLFVFLNPNNYNGDILTHFKTNAWDILMGYSGFMTISLWFVYVLFEVCFVMTVLHKLLVRQNDALKYGLLTVVGIVCIVWDAICKDMTLPFKLSHFFMSMFMYMLGYMLQHHIKNLSNIPMPWLAVCALITQAVAIMLYIAQDSTNLFLSEMCRVGMMLMSTASLISIVYVMTHSVRENVVGRSLRYIANNGMCVLAVHMWTICMCHLYLPYQNPYVIAILALIVSLLLAPITNRFTPMLVGKIVYNIRCRE